MSAAASSPAAATPRRGSSNGFDGEGLAKLSLGMQNFDGAVLSERVELGAVSGSGTLLMLLVLKFMIEQLEQVEKSAWVVQLEQVEKSAEQAAQEEGAETPEVMEAAAGGNAAPRAANGAVAQEAGGAVVPDGDAGGQEEAEADAVPKADLGRRTDAHHH